MPALFVALVLPIELRALDGTLLKEDTFVWLSTYWSTPQTLVMKNPEGPEDSMYGCYRSDSEMQV
ncbi:MAG: hypothetical protein DDT29_02384 [Dehalococcoidia bacterium]|nr:hypothetical protein [Bacillota bacterium]